MTDRLYPSTSFFDDKMVVIGRIEKEGPLDQLKRPFRDEAWILFGVMLGVFFAFGALVVWVFSPDSFSFINMALHFLGDYPGERDTAEDESQRTGLGNGAGDSTSTVSESDNESNNPMPPQRTESNEDVARNREALYKSAVLLWRIALSAFLVILLLFYEVAVVNFLFIEQSNPQGVRVTKLGRTQLREYAVLKNSALEDVWSRTGTNSFLYSTFSVLYGAVPRSCGLRLTLIYSSLFFSNMGIGQWIPTGNLTLVTFRGTGAPLRATGKTWISFSFFPAIGCE